MISSASSPIRRRTSESRAANGSGSAASELAPIPLDELGSHAPDGVELELHDGGQPHYWWQLAAQ